MFLGDAEGVMLFDTSLPGRPVWVASAYLRRDFPHMPVGIAGRERGVIWDGSGSTGFVLRSRRARKDVRWTARPGRSVVEPRAGAVLGRTLDCARRRNQRATSSSSTTAHQVDLVIQGLRSLYFGPVDTG
jgi:hypothetical protein